jgi:cytochrome c biogenesis protein CcmG/thiol:disulfide interchange protein DsbE
MDDHKKNESARIVAALMIAGGLIAIGLMFVFVTNDQYGNVFAVPSELSAVPNEMDYEAPQLELTSLDGTQVSLAGLRGRVVLVNLWATWCPPCLQEMPTLNAFYEKYKDQEFVLIGVNQEESREIVAPFVEDFGLSFPIWLDEGPLAQQAFKTVNLPSSYVIDREGRIRLMWIGGISKKNLEQYVPKIILE